MKRLPMNPREDADVIRTGVFPDATEPVQLHITVRCETCRMWQRKKWPAEHVAKFGEANEGRCLHPRMQTRIGYGETGEVPDTITGVYFSCQHWNP